MPVMRFPDPAYAGAESVVAFGGVLDVASLRLAYRKGIFPWPHEGYPLLWFCPPERAILDFANLHVPERLQRARRNTSFRYTIDVAFDQVIAACRESPRPGQEGTWITTEMENAYRNLHQAGNAHSVEVWDETNQLVGGLYGVSVQGTFAGESMFHTRSNASKFALLYLIDYLAARGLDWIDIQMMTPHMEALGATEITRSEYLTRLKTTQERALNLFP